MEVGDRVFYRDNGQEDTGTVKAIICAVEHFVYQVKWENDTNETAFLYSRYQLHSPKHFPQVGDEVQMDNDGHPMSNGKVTLVKKVASFFGCQVNWDKDPSDNDLYAPDQLELID